MKHTLHGIYRVNETPSHERQDELRVVLRGDPDLRELPRAAAQNMAGAVQQAFAQRAVRHEEDANHRSAGDYPIA